MAINEKTASFYHYFEPLYHVIHDLPRPPEALLSLRQGEDVAQVVNYSSNLYVTTSFINKIPFEPQKLIL